jgi:hypothetical protein
MEQEILHCVCALKKIKQRRKHKSDVPTPDEIPEQPYEEVRPGDPGEARDDLK